MHFVRVKGMGGVQRDVEKPHSFDVNFENRDVRSHPSGHAGSVDPGDAASQNHHAPRQHAGHTAQERAAAAEMFRQEIAAYEHRHPARDLAHRFEEREPAIDLDGFVSEGGDARGEERFGERFARRQMQVSEEDLAPSQKGDLGRLRFLDFNDQFRAAEDLSVIGRQGGAGLFVIRVGKAGADAGAGFDQDRVSAFGEQVNGGREQSDAVFLVFNLFGNPNDHGVTAGWRRARPTRSARLFGVRYGRRAARFETG